MLLFFAVPVDSSNEHLRHLHSRRRHECVKTSAIINCARVYGDTCLASLIFTDALYVRRYSWIVHVIWVWKGRVSTLPTSCMQARMADLENGGLHGNVRCPHIGREYISDKMHFRQCSRMMWLLLRLHGNVRCPHIGREYISDNTQSRQ